MANQDTVQVEKVGTREVKVTFPENVSVNADQIPPEELLRALTDSLFPPKAPITDTGKVCIILVEW